MSRNEFNHLLNSIATLSPEQMAELARLKLELWFDVYFVGDEDSQ